MRRTVQRALDRLFDALNDMDPDDGKDLWAILTALRGPDFKGRDTREAVKADYTSPIRRAAGLGAFFADAAGISLQEGEVSQATLADLEDRATRKRDDLEPGSGHRHFYYHMTQALAALRRD